MPPSLNQTRFPFSDLKMVTVPAGEGVLDDELRSQAPSERCGETREVL